MSEKQYIKVCFCCQASHPGPPAGAVAGIIPVGLLDVEHQLLAAVLFGALTHLGGQVLAVEQLHLVPQLFFGVKGVQLDPVGGKEPEFYKMFVQDPISSDAFRR